MNISGEECLLQDLQGRKNKAASMIHDSATQIVVSIISIYILGLSILLDQWSSKTIDQKFVMSNPLPPLVSQSDS